MIVRQFISWIRTAPAGERAEATRALARAWLISDLSRGRSHRRRRRAADAARRSFAAGAPGHGRSVRAQRRRARPPSCRRSSLDQPSIALPVLEHSPLLIDADLVDIVATGNGEMQCAIARRINLPPSVSRRDRRSRLRGRRARADRKRLCRTGAVFVGSHRRTSRPSRRDPGIDAGAGRSARRDAAGAGRQTLGDAGAIRRRAQLAERRPGRADRERSARALDREHRGAFARRRHAGAGAASARHRATDRGPDPARAAVGQSRTVRFCAGRIVGPAAGARLRAAARPRRRQPAGAADPRRFPGIDLRRLPRGARGQPRDRICRHARRCRETCADAWSSAC